MHIYTWDNRVPKFFSVDIYTCKEFNPADAIRYTEDFFADNLIKRARLSVEKMTLIGR